MKDNNELEVFSKAYFHINNGGMTLKLTIEGGEFYLTQELNSFGVGLETKISLPPYALNWLAENLNSAVTAREELPEQYNPLKSPEARE